MSKVLAFTVVYPQAEKYIGDFIKCLSQQTFSYFDVLIVNDRCNQEDISEAFSAFNTHLINSNESPSKNRQIGIEYAFNNNYDYLVFCDIDDWFLPNRFETSLYYIKNADIVVNNLNIVGEHRERLCDRYFSFSIDTSIVIDSNYLKDKNLLGLSNTAIKVQEKALVEFPKDISIGDWYYYSICAERGLTIVYCDDALTDYRQHDNNLIGIDDFSVSLFRKLIKLKIEHYSFMNVLYPSYMLLLGEARSLESLTDDELSALIKKNKNANAHPLWWENIKK